MYLETDVPGNPSAIEGAAAYLRESLESGADTLADEVHTQRGLLASAWEGEGGEAFHSRATTLAERADFYVTMAEAAAGELEYVASVLSVVQLGMGAVRTQAVVGGLQLSGTRVLAPAETGEGPAYETAVATWNTVVTDHAEHLQKWFDALEEATGFFKDHTADLVQMVVGLMTAGYSSYLMQKLAKILAGEAAFRKANVAALAGELEDMVDRMRSGRFYGTLDNYDHLVGEYKNATSAADEAAQAAKNPKLPGGIRGGLGALGVLATAYGVYDDVQSGESTEQAVVSQGGGLLAGLVAGGLTGFAVGTVAPGPGNVVGAISGALAGGVAGYFTDQQIDQMYEEGEEPPPEPLSEAELGELLEAHQDGSG